MISLHSVVYYDFPVLRLTPVILLVRWILQGLILPTLILKLFSLK